jgi:hypothetical protein
MVEVEVAYSWEMACGGALAFMIVGEGWREASKPRNH